MPVDTRGLQPEHVGKCLRVELAHGEFAEIRLLELTICAEPEPCCGITYRLIRTSQKDGVMQDGEVYWMGFRQIENFQVIGD